MPLIPAPQGETVPPTLSFLGLPCWAPQAHTSSLSVILPHPVSRSPPAPCSNMSLFRKSPGFKHFLAGLPHPKSHLKVTPRACCLPSDSPPPVPAWVWEAERDLKGTLSLPGKLRLEEACGMLVPLAAGAGCPSPGQALCFLLTVKKEILAGRGRRRHPQPLKRRKKSSASQHFPFWPEFMNFNQMSNTSCCVEC